MSTAPTPSDGRAMSDEQLRIAVAEAMGWKKQKGTPPTYGGSYTPAGWINPVGDFRKELPNFPESLDACAGFEAELDKDEVLASAYAKELFYLNSDNDFMTITAKPRARCLAYLATVAPAKLK